MQARDTTHVIDGSGRWPGNLAMYGPDLAKRVVSTGTLAKVELRFRQGVVKDLKRHMTHSESESKEGGAVGDVLSDERFNMLDLIRECDGSDLLFQRLDKR